MEAFRKVTGVAAPLPRADVDTDQIIPKQFLKRVERTGYGRFLFFDWRYLDDGTPDPDFVLNQEPWDRAQILLAGENFGCGSSREHAPWALNDFGIRVVIAPSFADIFANNCYQNGMLPVSLAEEEVGELVEKAIRNPGYELTVDLEEQEVRGEDGFRASFEVDPFRRECLLEGLDQVALTLQKVDEIEAYETAAGK